MGYPALILAEAGEEIRGQVLSSSRLEGEWDRIDEFEGDEYLRTTAIVKLGNGERVQAFVYVLRKTT